MKRESIFIGLACALGGGVGTWVAMHVSPWLSPVGFLLGGCLGWVSYDYHGFWRGIVRAYKEVIDWEPNRPRWAYTFNGAGAGLSLGSTAFIYYGGYHYFFTDITLQAYGLVVAGGRILMALLFGLISYPGYMNGTEEKRKEADAWGWCMMKWVNPITLPLTLLWLIFEAVRGVFLGIWWLLIRIPSAARTLGRFIKTAFLYIHSDERKICLVGATLAVCVGFYFRDPLVGAAAGFVLGLFSYYVVSVRWLRLLPHKTR